MTNIVAFFVFKLGHNKYKMSINVLCFYNNKCKKCIKTSKVLLNSVITVFFCQTDNDLPFQAINVCVGRYGCAISGPF